MMNFGGFNITDTELADQLSDTVEVKGIFPCSRFAASWQNSEVLKRQYWLPLRSPNEQYHKFKTGIKVVLVLTKIMPGTSFAEA
jgi:hypothetical protein